MDNVYMPNAADILYGSYIRYDRMYEMTKFAFYGKTDIKNLNVYIDVYSIIRSLYSKGSNISIKDSYAIASCIINLAIHIRAYFDTRHGIATKVYIIYGGARPREAFVNFYKYNEKNIIMEDSNYYMKELIKDNLDVLSILCPYLYDIFCIVDYENEFSVIASHLINQLDKNPNIIYSKDALSYQLVAFKPYTFMFRPKKRSNEDVSWVVTKSTLYNAYRYGELSIDRKIDTKLDVRMFSIYQSIAGIRSRSIKSTKNANSTILLLEKAVAENIFSNGYNANSIFYSNPNPFEILFKDTKVNPTLVTGIFASTDLGYQTMLYESSIAAKNTASNIINLYNPQEIRNINDKYFQQYPLDLNRV